MRRRAIVTLTAALTFGWALPATAGREPASEPEPAELPSYEFDAIPIDTPLRQVPRDGHGLLAGGSLAAAGGVAMFGATIYLAVDGQPQMIWGAALGLGCAASLVGGLMLLGGRSRQLHYRDWAAQQPDAIPRRGMGMVVPGGMLLTGGAALGMVGTIGWMVSTLGIRPPNSPGVHPILPAMVGVGVVSIATGTALLVVGMKRHERFQAWRAGEGLARVELVPGLAPLPGGAQIGVAGRF